MRGFVAHTESVDKSSVSVCRATGAGVWAASIDRKSGFSRRMFFVVTTSSPRMVDVVSGHLPVQDCVSFLLTRPVSGHTAAPSIKWCSGPSGSSVSFRVVSLCDARDVCVKDKQSFSTSTHCLGVNAKDLFPQGHEYGLVYRFDENSSVVLSFPPVSVLSIDPVQVSFFLSFFPSFLCSFFYSSLVYLTRYHLCTYTFTFAGVCSAGCYCGAQVCTRSITNSF